MTSGTVPPVYQDDVKVRISWRASAKATPAAPAPTMR
jgi:hypothetical protein